MPIDALRRRAARRASGPPFDTAALRRDRLLEAMAFVAGEQGTQQASVAAVVARAGLSKRALYDLYESRDACLIAAWGVVAEQVTGQVVDAYMKGADAVRGIELALEAFLAFCADKPEMARTYLVEGPATGPLYWDEHSRRLADLAACALAAARADAPATASPMVVGGVCTVVRTRLVEDRADELAELGPELTAAVWAMAGIG